MATSSLEHLIQTDSMPSRPSSLTASTISLWLQDLRKHGTSDSPQDLSTLISTSRPLKLTLGTGSQIYTSFLPALTTTQSELILVTCFWASSSSQSIICTLLKTLSQKALLSSPSRKIRVYIHFSSRSIWQKLSQTSSLDGKIYGPEEWKRLGLPAEEEIEGVELHVKSVFVRPFCVMHPKFIIMDRRRVILPSCNVSWEEWFEGCIEMEGPIVQQLLEFWRSFWIRGELPSLPPVSDDPLEISEQGGGVINSTSLSSPTNMSIPTILLPSTHHQNPLFRPFPCQITPPPPPTPLNTFLLILFSAAKKEIYIQTPNLTCGPVISALLSALSRGVSVTIITSRRLMVLEQLVTAGTVTEYEIWKVLRKYRKFLKNYEESVKNVDRERRGVVKRPGVLRVGYFVKKEGEIGDAVGKSHFKCSIVDEEVVVLGSGNMDRASWYTSQELDVAILDGAVVERIMGCLWEGLEGRVDWICQWRTQAHDAV